MGFYDFKAENAYGDMVSMREFEGKVVLIVNTATECGFTPQYDELQDIYEEFQNDGLEILDFPCPQFGHQLPKTNEEIVSFCDAHFGITFRHFSIVDVNGEKALPLFRYLQEQKGFGGFQPEHPLTPMMESMLERSNPNYKNEPDIKWNFTKFLIDRKGNVVARFEPTEDMGYVIEQIKSVL